MPHCPRYKKYGEEKSNKNKKEETCPALSPLGDNKNVNTTFFFIKMGVLNIKHVITNT